jgi:hypothetical protein
MQKGSVPADGMRSGRKNSSLDDPNPCKSALSELQHATVDRLGGAVEDIDGDRLAVEPDPALGQRAPRLRGLYAER